ncbi:MAG: MmgE/PrpD family protein [Alphaproteobacteria bacterium]|nr:MmgE/PrpD family protein [Alphaproteobacteria bacterium]
MKKAFGEFVLNLGYEDIPAEVLKTMHRSLLDTIGVAAIGSQSEISAIVKKFTAAHMPCAETTPAAHMLFGGQKTSPMGAAMAGAFTIDSIDAHDGYSAVKGHAGSAVLPGVLAIIDALVNAGQPVSGRDLIAALTIGYEVSYRSGLTLHATTPDYHTSGAWTAVGVAAAGARLLGLNESQLRHAVGIAEYHGPRSQMLRCIDHPTMLRDGVGWGAPTGVSAAYLAAEGFTGAPAITVDSDEAAPFWSDLGTRWEISNTHYKAYPVCRWAHPAIDAVSDLMTEHNLTSSQIERAQISTFHYATRLAGHAPESIDELTYALAYPFAIMAVRGKIGLEELQPSVLADPEIQRISRATSIKESAHYTKISTRKRWADVTLYLTDGTELKSQPYTPRGDPDNALSDEEISAKFHLFTDNTLGKARADSIEAMVTKSADDDFDLAALLDLVFAAP